MSVEIPASAQPDLTPRRGNRVQQAGALAAFSLVVASGAVLTSSCCALPLALAMAGIGGTWLSSLSTLVPYKGYVLATAILPLAVGWVMAVRSYTKGCASGRTKAWTFGVLTVSTALVSFAALSNLIEPQIVAYLMSLRG